MADPTLLQYYTEYNSYKNLGVYSGSIAVDTSSIAAGSSRNWDTTITVEPNSKFSNCLIQVNKLNGLGVTALVYEPFPPAYKVWQTLSVDPAGAGSMDINLQLIINGNQVTFRGNAFNPFAGSMAFNALTINFVYAIHTLDK